MDFDFKNYQNWRNIHTRTFGDLFSQAFKENEQAGISLCAALIHISNRRFEDADPILDALIEASDCEFDTTAVNYFKGLNCELSEKEEEMEKYYENLKNASPFPIFQTALHPYYRTAKTAQRNSECAKAFYYFRKALEFYDGTELSQKSSAIAALLIYDIATLLLYMHRYEEARRFLRVSYSYDKSENPQRNYVSAVLLALNEKETECKAVIKTLPFPIREACEKQIYAILCKTDPHYFAINEDRDGYGDFWSSFLKKEQEIKNLLLASNTESAQEIISRLLTDTLSFMNRDLECRITNSDGKAVVKCKNYYTKTLCAEHAALFSMKPDSLYDWEFLSIEEFEAACPI